MRPTNHENDPTWPGICCILLTIAVILASCWPSGASGADKTSTEGWYGPVRIKTVETAVSPVSGETITKGWIGGSRVSLRKDRHGKTTGWIGDAYISTRTAPSQHESSTEPALETLNGLKHTDSPIHD